MALLCAACASLRVPPHHRCDISPKFHPDASFADWDESNRTEPADQLSPTADSATPSGAADALLVTYQKYLRRPMRKGEGCPFRPSCSAFARQAFQRYREIGGVVLTLDRLFVRENSSLAQYYPAYCSGMQVHRYDPVP